MKNLYWLLGGVFFCIFSIGVFFFISSEKSNLWQAPMLEKASVESGSLPAEKSEKVVQMEVFYDFTCPHCKSFYTDTIVPLMENHSEGVNISLLPYPLKTEGKSFEMAKWLMCAKEVKGEGIAWSFLSQVQPEDDRAMIDSYLELDEERSELFTTCVNAEETGALVIAIRDEARERGVRGTPTFFLEEKKFERNQPLESVLLYLEKASQDL